MQQMSLFDFIKKEKTDVPILFHMGDTLYLVRKADVECCMVCEKNSWLIHNDSSRGYRILFKNGCYGVITNESLGVEVFSKKEDALKKAKENASTLDMISADKIQLHVLENYEYYRDSSDYKMRSYMADMGNGFLYIKDFMTYIHVVKDTPKARKEYQKRIAEKAEYIHIMDSSEVIQPVNMYKCKNDGEWVYAEARYMH